MTTRLGHRLIVWMSKHMIACDEAGFLISMQEDHSLGIRQWWQLKMHLLSCHLCRKYAHQIGQLNYSMKQYRDHCSSGSCTHHLPPETGSHIHEVLADELNAK